MRDITFGQYFPAESALHRMDPRVKLVATFLYIIAVFIPHNWLGLFLAVAFFFVCLLLSKLPVGMVLRSVKPIIPLILLTSLLNVFYIDKGTLWVKWHFIEITDVGVYTSIFIAIRIMCLIVGSSLMTYTTTPTALTDGMERLFSPLKVFHVHVHELAMMMTIALRFIPTLIEETDKIMAAQKARGADIENGSAMQRIKAFVPILIPLFVSSFRRAYELATAMECRCYQGGDGRTRMKQLHMRPSDVVALVVVIVFLGVLIATNFLGMNVL